MLHNHDLKIIQCVYIYYFFKLIMVDLTLILKIIYWHKHDFQINYKPSKTSIFLKILYRCLPA